jgi:hypothetical protein
LPSRFTRTLLAVCLSSLAICLGGCEELKTNTIADDSFLVTPDDGGTLAVDGGSLEDAVREGIEECRRILIDAGRGSGPPQFDYCSIAWFYEGCPLRVCAEELARKIRPRCPPRDAGVETTDSKLCDTVVWPFVSNEP